MLGTGNAFGKKYFNNNALLYAKDYTLLIDCGVTASLSLYVLGKSIQEIDGILITHLHGDHVGGIEEIAYQLYYIFKKRISLFVPSTLVEPIWENCLKAGLHNGQANCTLETYFDVIVINERQPFSITSNLTIETICTEHIPNKFSYSLIINNLVFYSADIQFNPSLLEKVLQVHHCKYILHDCQLTSPGIVHTTLEDLLSLPTSVQEKIQLMHYDDNMEDFIGKSGKMSFMKQHHIYDYY